ncbi:hypothetical protein SLEP1_g16041 [Rubroshorea leprosula]|uniref:Uncharacterized protein n=1 Tax=Rubroshorea leprosula TaxID=152421 RepID=A0AAV5IYC9_9ROSI|nr:hypothetical protein SLEP1_g16041 [Rubroshorea leprosula]
MEKKTAEPQEAEGGDGGHQGGDGEAQGGGVYHFSGTKAFKRQKIKRKRESRNGRTHALNATPDSYTHL